jgi:hypothetical protein
VSLCIKHRKERYSSRVVARRALRQWHGNDQTLDTYYCHACFAWHYGHPKKTKGQPNAIPRRRSTNIKHKRANGTDSVHPKTDGKWMASITLVNGKRRNSR